MISITARKSCGPGRIPHDVIIQNEAFVPEMVGVNPARGIYAHIIGIDIVRVGENDFYVLEDNCRTPSGVSYMLEDREAMMYLFPDLFAQQRVAPVENYPAMLRKTLESVAPPPAKASRRSWCLPPAFTTRPSSSMPFSPMKWASSSARATISLSPMAGSICARRKSRKRVDVVYRRIDDAYLDPLAFRPDSALGVPGHLRCLSRGPCHPGQCAGHRHRRRQVDLHLHARHHRVLYRRKAAAQQRADLALRRSRGS